MIYTSLLGCDSVTYCAWAQPRGGGGGGRGGKCTHLGLSRKKTVMVPPCVHLFSHHSFQLIFSCNILGCRGYAPDPAVCLFASRPAGHFAVCASFKTVTPPLTPPPPHPPPPPPPFPHPYQNSGCIPDYVHTCALTHGYKIIFIVRLRVFFRDDMFIMIIIAWLCFLEMTT